MAVLKNIRADHTLPVLGGRYIVKTWRGKLVIQSWPKKRSRPLPAQTLAQNERFKNANFLAKFAPPDQQKMAIELGKKGPLYPRDYLTAAMTSGLYIFQLGPNRKVYPVSVRNEISAELDIIAQTPGSLMGRGEEYWEPITPGALYQVPAVITPGGAPVMTSPGPEIGGHSVTAMARTTENTGATAAKGIHFEPFRDMQVVSIIPSFNSVNAAVYKCQLWRWDGNKLLELITESPTQSYVGAFFFRRQYPLNELVTLTAGTKYVALFVRTDATDATNNKCFSSGETGNGGYPSNDAIGWAQWAKKAPAVNDVVASTGFQVPFCIDLIYKF